jgi:hypothetical protein
VNKKVDGQRKRKPEKSTKGKIAIERIQMGRSRSKKIKEKGATGGRIITGVKLGVKEKRQEKGEEERCMKRKVYICNKWWKIMKIYNKEVKSTREVGRTSEESTNPFRKSARTGRSPSRSEEGDQSKGMDNEMKNMIRETREDTEGIREENKVLRKELEAVREEKGELRKELEAVREEMRGREGKWHAEKAD